MASAAILAGGRASRYGGRDKGALVVGGRAILERQLTELGQVADDVMIVGSPDSNAALPRPVPTGVRLVHDRVPGRGPLGGLDAALAFARDDAMVLVACDMPFVTAALFAYLLALTPEADAVVPRTERGYHPLCAVYTRACREPVGRQLAAGRLRMIELFEVVRVRAVAGGELDALGNPHRLLANVNTPADYDGIRALAAHEL